MNQVKKDNGMQIINNIRTLPKSHIIIINNGVLLYEFGQDNWVDPL